MCDSAEPKSIADLEANGINALPVVKVERRFGYKYLQSFNQIIIDPRRCPHAAEEFALAEYKKLASGLFPLLHVRRLFLILFKLIGRLTDEP